MNDDQVSEDHDRSVTIFGAGVAGLTAAHELVERGFKVEVIDPDIREEIHNQTLGRGIGGMARSQWAGVIEGLPSKEPVAAGNIPRLDTAADLLLDEVIVFDEKLAPVDGWRTSQLLDRAAALIKRVVDAAANDESLRPTWTLTMIVPSTSAKTTPSSEARVAYVKAQLVERLGASFADAVSEIEATPVDPGELMLPDHPLPARDMESWLFFQLLNAHLFPAEHGFRFFPSFYRHVFDSLLRIPIRNPRPHERTHKSAMENLVPCEGLGFARGGVTKSFMIPRHEIKSLEAARHYLKLVLTELGYELEDVSRFGLKLLEYMTSCTKRRAGVYENISWGRFVEQKKYSPISRRHIEYGPQMSAALRGSLSDARTQGTISVQLILDQLHASGQPDCLLNGPTDSAWLDHWHDYLTMQGVQFRRGALTDFYERDGEILPKVFSRFMEKDGELVPDPASEMTPTGESIILALSLPAAVDVAKKFLAVAGPRLKPDNDFTRVIDFAGDLATDLKLAAPEGPLQHLSGIQFYFRRPMSFWRGHTQYLDAEWGLTSIAQSQFWGRARDWTHSYRGILSVDIGIWDRASETSGKTAWDSTASEIAAGAWQQIRDHHDDAFRARYGENQPLPFPAWYAIDTNLDFTTPKKNHTPFLVNRVGAYPKRPGRLLDDWCRDHPETKPTTSKQISFYDVHLGKYVLVGTFMKTYTRLTSMEGANESARHGVNALLTYFKVPTDHCEIWDPEDNEIADLQWLRDLDEKRYEDGLPHVLTTLGSLSLGSLNLEPALVAAAKGAV